MQWVHKKHKRANGTTGIAHVLLNAEGVHIGMVLKLQGTRTYKHKYAGYVNHFGSMGMLPACSIGAKTHAGRGSALRTAKRIVHARCNNYNLPYNG